MADVESAPIQRRGVEHRRAMLQTRNFTALPCRHLHSWSLPVKDKQLWILNEKWKQWKPCHAEVHQTSYREISRCNVKGTKKPLVPQEPRKPQRNWPYNRHGRNATLQGDEHVHFHLKNTVFAQTLIDAKQTCAAYPTCCNHQLVLKQRGQYWE